MQYSLPLPAIGSVEVDDTVFAHIRQEVGLAIIIDGVALKKTLLMLVSVAAVYVIGRICPPVAVTQLITELNPKEISLKRRKNNIFFIFNILSHF